MKVRKNKKLQVALKIIEGTGDITEKHMKHFNYHYWELAEFINKVLIAKLDYVIMDNKILTLTEKGKKIYEKMK